MSELSGRPLARRVLAERRGVLLPLAVALVLNVVAYVVVVYPLSQRVANVEQRNATAARALATATGEHTLAVGTLTGKDRAAAQLRTFYTSVLPVDFAGARRLTHLRLAQLAREVNLRSGRVLAEPVAARGSSLTRLDINMELEGSYADVRRFIHELETAREFVVVDNVELTEDAESSTRLNLTVALSTYYRTATR